VGRIWKDRKVAGSLKLPRSPGFGPHWFSVAFMSVCGWLLVVEGMWGLEIMVCVVLCG
jgi:hypothetical protein